LGLVVRTLYLPAKGEEYRWGLNDEEHGLNNPHLALRKFYFEPFKTLLGGPSKIALRLPLPLQIRSSSSVLSALSPS
jgi:hypothetical protein